MENDMRNYRIVSAVAVLSLFLATLAASAQDKKDIEPNKIPKNVMDALKTKFPKAEIHKCTKEKEDGKVVYDIEFKQEGRKFEADITEAGVITNWEKEIAASDLPNAVKAAVEKKYPKSTLKDIMLCTDIKEGKETLHGYEITLDTADKKAVEVTVAADGKILEDSTEKK